MSYKVDKVFEVDPDLELREELLSITSINPFLANTSSARLIMQASHLSQSLTINNGDEKIIQTGLEKQLSNNTFSKKVDKDCRVIKVIPRYRGIGVNTVSNVTELLVIVEYLEDGVIDAISVPDHHTLHQYFGFKYKWNNDILNQLTPGTILHANTVLADSPAVTSNGGYKFGANANLALMSLPETAEDGIVISKSFSEKMSYTVFETRVVEFGSKNFPLNMYGDTDNYKPFPEIGEMINDDSILMVLRDYDINISPALVSINDVCDYDVTFDKCVYVKGPGEKYNVNGKTIISGKIVDIVAYASPRYKKDTYTGTIDIVEKYVNGYKKYLTDILDVYTEITTEHYRRYKNNDVKLAERFHRLIVDAMAVANVNSNKIGYTARNENMDLYRLEFKIEYTIASIPIGSKLSDSFGVDSNY